MVPPCSTLYAMSGVIPSMQRRLLRAWFASSAGKLLPGCFRERRWPYRLPIVPDSRYPVEDTERRQMLNCGLNDFDMRLLLHYLREGDIFSALGANVGAYTCSHRLP